MPLVWGFRGAVFRWSRDPTGRATRVLVDLDGAGFSDVWLAAVEAAQSG
jgi:hypothetical protein